jgi:type II secretory pathway pseudopilin PulG
MTLIEVLIAVTLVALLTVGMMFALRAGLGSMEGANRAIGTSRRALGAQRIIEQQTAGFLPVVARCGVAVNPQGVPTPFFQGEPGVMRFVSRYSLAEGARGLPQVLEYFVAPGAQGEGVRLLVNEIPYRNPLSAGLLCLPPRPDPAGGPPLPQFAPPVATPASFVLADRLAACQFLYQEPLPGPPHQRWLPRWIRNDVWPTAIRVEMAPLGVDPSRVQPVPFTALLRITRPPLEPYVP